MTLVSGKAFAVSVLAGLPVGMVTAGLPMALMDSDQQTRKHTAMFAAGGLGGFFALASMGPLLQNTGLIRHSRDLAVDAGMYLGGGAGFAAGVGAAYLAVNMLKDN